MGMTVITSLHTTRSVAILYVSRFSLRTVPGLAFLPKCQMGTSRGAGGR